MDSFDKDPHFSMNIIFEQDADTMISNFIEIPTPAIEPGPDG